MELKYFISEIMLFNAVATFAASLFLVLKRRIKDIVHRLFLLLMLSSTIWSLGFSFLYVQTDVAYAHFWKCFAIAGTVCYMISVQAITVVICGLSKKSFIFFQAVALMGLPVYILSAMPSMTTYYISEQFGFMTYTFHGGVVNIIYTAYFGVVSFNILIAVVLMLVNRKYARLRATGKRFLVMLLLNLVGTVFDMIFPVIGYDMLPGSNVTQCWAVLIVGFAVREIDRNRISVENMAEYVYYFINEPVVITDMDGSLKIVNQAAGRFFGFVGPGDYERKKLADILILPEDDFFESERKEATYELKDKAMERPCDVAISRVSDRYGDTIGFLVIVQDISERVKYIEALRQSREEAEMSNLTKTTFLANMSHEIRTPMNSIIGFSEILLKSELSKDRITEYTENIRDSAYDLLNIINEILDITKVESGKVVININSYDLKKLLDSVYVQISSAAKNKGLKLEMKLDPGLPSVLEGDETKIREVLVNILNNAVKYTESGSVTLSARAGYNEDRTRAELVVEVEDTGVGIREEDLDSIFIPFEQVNKNLHAGIEGTGLGLAIVKGYMEAMGGSVNVESTFGKGSKFTISVMQDVVDLTPMERNETRTPDGKSHIGELKFDGIRVLVVDDNMINLKVASRALECYGIVPDMAENGRKAVEMCRENEYPIVFLDQMMPEMDGIETMKQIRLISGYYADRAKIVALTANALVEVRNQLISEGFDEYLKKPIEFLALESLLVRYLNGGE